MSGTAGGRSLSLDQRAYWPSQSPERQQLGKQHAVRDIGCAKWPVLTCMNYGEWAVLMKVKLRARKLLRAIEVGIEDEDCAAMEAILFAVPLEYVESLGSKNSTELAWDALEAMRVGPHKEGEGATASAGVRGTGVPRW